MKLPVNYNSLTPRERREVRVEYTRLQKGRCWYCNAQLWKNPAPKVATMQVKRSLFPTNFFAWKVHLHHNHTTGLTIGAVHAHCNAVLWQYHKE